METPKVGILIPVYNAQNYLQDCILSVLDQTYKNIAIYAVDDNSTDHSVEILDTFPAIKYVKHSENMGFAKSFNDAAIMAIGDKCEYVFTLCNDDKLMDIAIELLVEKALQNPHADWVSCYGQMFGNDDKIMTVNHNANWKDFKEANQLLSFALFKSETWQELGGYDECFAKDLGLKSAYEDWEFWIRLLKAGKTYEVVAMPLYQYRMREGQLHHTLAPNHHDLVKYIYKKHFI